MRALVAATALALASLVAGTTPALAVDRHLHCLTTPGGTTTIAAGLTANGPQAAFDQFHFQVHFGALANPNNPVTVAGIFTGSCPQ
ncbi:MAG TPA: hypothetical protein VJP45_04395 [Candidatus Limnocylindria bacterium]|nr:hypothetical protein [Candidatus Limnocylindria bacterium]